MIAAALRHARLVAEREAVAAAIPADVGFALSRAEARVRSLEQQLRALERGDGWGVLRHTPVGEAAVEWRHAADEQRSCVARAEQARLWERHRLRQQAARAAAREGPLRERFDELARSARARIESELPEAKRDLAELDEQSLAHVRFRIAHPEAFSRLDRLDHEIAEVAYELALDRAPLDGIVPKAPESPGLEHPALDRGVELGIGL